MSTKKTESKDNTLARNKKARHDYEVLEKMEAGIALTGTEVKSCREHNISLQESYASVVDGEVKVFNMHISQYRNGNIHNHEPKRTRRLLLHKAEIRKCNEQVGRKGLTLVPLSMYLKRGRVKVCLGVCRGKTKGDKRQTLKRREDERSMRRAMRK